MFLDPSSQHFNQLRQTEEIPARLQSLLIEGSNKRCLISREIQILSQQILHPEFDLYIHHVFSKSSLELFGKVTTKKWWWVMQHEGDMNIGLAGNVSFALKVNEHFFTQAEAAKENRFSFTQGRSVTLMISLKPAGEKMLKEFYGDLLKRLQKPGAFTVHGSTFIERYYRARLLLPDVVPILLYAFLSQLVRMLLLIFNQQLINASNFTGLPGVLERKVILAKQLLDQYPGEAWALRELARRTGWNIQDLKVIFKQVYQATPMQYLRKSRLQLAVVLVRTTDETIVAISRTCGFKRSHHFIRAFKEFTGKTPGVMRREG